MAETDDPMAADEGADEGATADGGLVLAAAAAAIQLAGEDEAVAAAAPGAREVTVRFEANGDATVVAGAAEATVPADMIARHLGLDDDSADDAGDEVAAAPPPPEQE